MNTKLQMRAINSLLLAFLLLLTSNVQAREMQTGSDAYTFSTYMIDAFYSEGESCEEKLLASPTIGWLCAAFPLGQNAFEHRWEAYLSALPETYSITAVTSWGDIKYEEDDTVFYGKIYDLNDGRLVVGYDQNDRGSEIRLGFSSTANQATATQNTAQNTVQTQVQPQQTNQVQQVAQTQPATQVQQVAQAQVAQTQMAQTQTAQQQQVFLTAEQTRARDQAIALHNYNQQQASNQQTQQQNYTQQANTQNTYAGTSAAQQSSVTPQTNTSINYAATSQPSTMPASSAMVSAMASATNTNLATSSVVNTAQQLPQNQYTTTETPIQATAQGTSTTSTLTTQRAYNATQSSTAAAQLASSPAMSSASITNLATSSVVNDAVSTANATTPQAIAQQIDQAVNSSLQQLQSAPLAPAVTESPDLLGNAATLESTNQLNSEILQTETLDALQTQEVMALAQNLSNTEADSEASTLGASAILDVFRQKGLAVNNPKNMTTKDYGFAPVLADEGIFFNIGDCTSCIGRIFSFEREEDVAMMEVYYSLEAQATDIVYANDNTLLQFFSTPKELAQEYITTLESLD